jgi:uncharacterized protein (TIGR00369 family)
MEVNVTNEGYTQRVKGFLERQHFMHLIGFDLNIIEEGRTQGRLPLEKKHMQQKGFAHGGLVATLADIVMGFAAYTLVPEQHHVVTGELKVSYLNPGIGEELEAVGWVLKSGRKINFCEAEIWAHHQGNRTLIAKASSSMVTIFPEDIAQQ